jgi:hypothetical protein
MISIHDFSLPFCAFPIIVTLWSKEYNAFLPEILCPKLNIYSVMGHRPPWGGRKGSFFAKLSLQRKRKGVEFGAALC